MNNKTEKTPSLKGINNPTAGGRHTGSKPRTQQTVFRQPKFTERYNSLKDHIFYCANSIQANKFNTTLREIM